MKSRLLFVLFGWLGAVGSQAIAHPGPRIWLDVVEGQVTTYSGPYPPGHPANYRPALVFAQALVGEDDVWYTDFPGFQQVPGGSLVAGSTFSYDIMGPLLWYQDDDPALCPRFLSVADHFEIAPPQMALTNELFQTKITANGFVSGDIVFAYNGNSGDHNHLTFTLLGDGQDAEGGPNGIYALPLRLTTNGAAPSATFHLLLGKNVSPSVLVLAMDVIEHPRIGPDLDCDGDVDLDDFVLFEGCLTGLETPLPFEAGSEHCRRADVDGDHHVSLADYARFLLCFSGSGVAVAQECLH